MMGDYRLSVKISLVGIDGMEAKIDWWLNWCPEHPYRLWKELVKKAEEVGLPSSACDLKTAQEEIKKLQRLARMGRLVVEDFMKTRVLQRKPNIGMCALQDYGRLNNFLLQTAVLPDE